MTAKNVRIVELSVIWAIMCAMLLFIFCGCATEGMRESWEQGYVNADAGDTEDVKATMSAAMDKWGRPQLRCTPETVQRTVANIQNEWSIVDVFDGAINWTLLFGAGGTGTILLTLLRQYLAERGKRKGIEAGAGDCAAAIEKIPDIAIRLQTKDAVRKLQASRLPLNKIVQKE